MHGRRCFGIRLMFGSDVLKIDILESWEPSRNQNQKRRPPTILYIPRHHGRLHEKR
jgi:hypothetical protein